MKTVVLSLVASILVAACSSSDPDPAPAPAPRPEGEFIGVSSDGSTSLAILASNTQVVAYACNDAEIGSWFEAPIGESTLKNARGESLVLTGTATGWNAVLNTGSGVTKSFTTVRPQPEEGLFMLVHDGSPIAPTDHRLGAAVLDTLQKTVIKADASSQGEGFRVGWVVGPGAAFRGNLSSKNVARKPNGVPAPIDSAVVRRASVPGGILLNGIKINQSVDEAGGSVAIPTSNPCGDIDFSAASCCAAIKFNDFLIKLSNTATSLGVESDTLDSMLNECSNNLTTLCPNNAAAACGTQ